MEAHTHTSVGGYLCSCICVEGIANLSSLGQVQEKSYLSGSHGKTIEHYPERLNFELDTEKAGWSIGLYSL